MKNNTVGPVKHRFVVLDALRGFALFGIILANFPEFSLWTFQTDEALQRLPSPEVDSLVRFFLYVFVDGKFYTIFSILFGIGFSIIIANAVKKGADGFRIFYRRMTILALIGLAHLLLVWSGDILMLYALMGMLLPLFWRCTDGLLLRWAAFFLLLPIGIEVARAAVGWSLAEVPYGLWWSTCDRFGITEQNFGTWLRDIDGYRGLHQFLMQGAWERLWEFVDGNRYFKVLGLFLIGLYIGRRRLYAAVTPTDAVASQTAAQLSGNSGYSESSEHSGTSCNTIRMLRRVMGWGTAVGLPLSFVYAWSATNGHPWGNITHSLLYTASVYPLGLAYIAAFALLFRRAHRTVIWTLLGFSGRMALTNYLSQSLCGIALFYGIGLGMGSHTTLVTTEVLAISVFLGQILVSALWLKYFQFGPLEWVWRMLTYGRRMPIRKEPSGK